MSGKPLLVTGMLTEPAICEARTIAGFRTIPQRSHGIDVSLATPHLDHGRLGGLNRSGNARGPFNILQGNALINADVWMRPRLPVYLSNGTRNDAIVCLSRE